MVVLLYPVVFLLADYGYRLPVFIARCVPENRLAQRLLISTTYKEAATQQRRQAVHKRIVRSENRLHDI